MPTFCRFTTLALFVLAACGTDAEAVDEDVSDTASDSETDAADGTGHDTGPDDAGPDDTGIGSDTLDDAADAPPDDATDALEDPVDTADAAPFVCGDAECAPSEVCVSRCLCCGIDTGNPADQRSEYECVTPPADCEDRPSTCALSLSENRGCVENGEREVACPCA